MVRGTRPGITQGWSTLGDVGRLDADGYLYLSDRRVDLIIVGGVNIYPQEIENVLTAHPAVCDAAVVGVPDQEMGQRVVAVVQAEPSADFDLGEQLLAHCRARLAGSSARARSCSPTSCLGCRAASCCAAGSATGSAVVGELDAVGRGLAGLDADQERAAAPLGEADAAPARADRAALTSRTRNVVAKTPGPRSARNPPTRSWAEPLADPTNSTA